MSDAIEKEKARIRAEIGGRLDAMSDAERRAASHAACDRLISLDAFRSASIVMLYMPLQREVDVTPAAISAFQMGKSVCVPKVDWKRRDMVPIEVTTIDDDVMDRDEHGLRSPKDGRLVVPGAIDLVVVPGLAFDVHGHRLGRGSGYYDRSLKRLRRKAKRLALAYDVQVIDAVPAGEDDLSVQMIVTDRRLIRARGRRGRP